MGTPGPDAERTGLVVVTGRFDTSKIEAMALEDGGATEQYKGTRLLVMSHRAKGEDSAHGPEMAMGFLAEGVVAPARPAWCGRRSTGAPGATTCRRMPR